MQLINSSFEILEQGPGLEGIYRAIEKAGRTCYKSEDKITSSSAKKFVNMLMARQHYAMLEHGSVYLKLPWDKFAEYLDPIEPKDKSVYDHDWVRYIIDDDFVYVSSNYRWIIENGLQDLIEYHGDPIDDYHVPRYSVKFTTDRGVSHELVRHRVFSFAQESTRYKKIAA